MTPLVNNYEVLLEAISLAKGAHQSRDGGMCAMEAAAYIAGEPHSDHPKCACPVITRFLVSWNDSLPTDEDRNRLIKPLLPLVVDTAGDKALSLRRSFMALDWLLRECAPTFLALTPSLVEHAETLRSSPEVTTIALAKQIAPKAAAARAAAGVAARAAAWVAAGAAARVAAWDAAWDAAGAAAWDAAWDAAGDAAWDAAGAAAGAALKPAVESLQASAVLLVRRMCEVND